MTTVDYWFDPVCPWSWVTSRWIHEVVGAAGLDVNWHPMSLGILNAAPNSNARMKEFFDILKGPVRVCAAVSETSPGELGTLYTTIGEHLHGPAGPLSAKQVAGDDFPTAVLRSRDAMVEATRSGLVEAGLDESFVESFDDARMDDVLLASHGRVPSDHHAQELIGVPTISIDGSAGLFGPVLTEVPPGPRAVTTWNAFAALAQEPAFYELKRTAERPAPRTF
ncbi:MAG: hypothetical protein HQ526_08960 [Actinobacteria bacterium]|nr:hypothetical protein [Actinomycetota bacterium]